MIAELTQNQQHNAELLNERISAVMRRAALDYVKTLLDKVHELPADEFLQLSDGVIRSASVEAANLLIASIETR